MKLTDVKYCHTYFAQYRASCYYYINRKGDKGMLSELLKVAKRSMADQTITYSLSLAQ